METCPEQPTSPCPTAAAAAAAALAADSSAAGIAFLEGFSQRISKHNKRFRLNEPKKLFVEEESQGYNFQMWLFNLGTQCKWLREYFYKHSLR